MAENEIVTHEKPAEADPLSPAERQYFSSRGEKPLPPESEPPKPEAEAPEAPEAAASEGAPSENKTVPHGALAEERSRRKAAEEKAHQAELMQARMEERFRAWQQMTTPPRRPAPPPPSADKDIFGAVNHIQREQQRTTAEINAYKRQIAANQQMEQLGNWGAAAESEFKQQTPDYDAALRHLRQGRGNELKRVFGMNDVQVNYQLVNEERQLLAEAARRRVNPAAMAYQLAQQRGYRKGAAPANGDTGQQMDRISAGQQAAGSLSNMGGASGTGREIGLKDLVAMSDVDFVTFKNKYPGKYRRLKGG